VVQVGLLLLLLLVVSQPASAEQSITKAKNNSTIATKQSTAGKSKNSNDLVFHNKSSKATYDDEKNVPFERWQAMYNEKTPQLLAEVNRFGYKRMEGDAWNYWLGTAYDAFDDLERSVTHFDRIHDYSKISDFGLDKMAHTYLGLTELDKVLTLTQIQINRRNPTESTFMRRGDALLNLGKIEDAAATYMQGLAAVKPGRRALLLEKAASAYIKLKNYDEAVKCLTEAIEQRGFGAGAPLYLTRGLALRAQGKYELAVNDFSACLERVHRSTHSVENQWSEVSALMDRAKCYDSLGRHDLAARDYASHKKLSQGLESDFFGK